MFNTVTSKIEWRMYAVCIPRIVVKACLFFVGFFDMLNFLIERNERMSVLILPDIPVGRSRHDCYA
jgi:hypothetical protein